MNKIKEFLQSDKLARIALNVGFYFNVLGAILNVFTGDNVMAYLQIITAILFAIAKKI